MKRLAPKRDTKAPKPTTKPAPKATSKPAPKPAAPPKDRQSQTETLLDYLFGGDG